MHFIKFMYVCVCVCVGKPVKTMIWFQHLTATIEKLVPANRQKSHAKDKQAPASAHSRKPKPSQPTPLRSVHTSCLLRNVPKSKVANEKLKCSYA